MHSEEHKLSDPIKQGGASIRVYFDAQCVDPIIAFVSEYAKQQDISAEIIAGISGALSQILNLLISAGDKEIFREEFVVRVYKEDGFFNIIFFNKGFPMFVGQEWQTSNVDKTIQNGINLLSSMFSSIDFQNMGREGQTLGLKVELNKDNQATAFSNQNGEHTLARGSGEVTYRDLEVGDETTLSRLFFAVYGYNYINDYVYFPQKIREMIQSKKLKSRVAVLRDGRFAAHVGLLQINQNPSVYEIALGLTDPRVPIRGMFSKLFDQVISTIDQHPMDYCIFDFVTNHDYSQKLVAKYDSKEICLNVGCQLSKTQAKLEKLGIGEDPKFSDRYSLLLAIKDIKPKPFGNSVVLPTHLGEMLDFLLENIGISWIPAPRFSPLGNDGSFEKKIQNSQKAVYFEFDQPGYEPMKQIVADWAHLLKNNFLYAAVDIPLNYPGVGLVADYLASKGFFIAGLVPYKNSNQLGFRMQSVGPTRIDFSEIKIATDTGKKLLETVQKSYERNVIL